MSRRTTCAIYRLLWPTVLEGGEEHRLVSYLTTGVDMVLMYMVIVTKSKKNLIPENFKNKGGGIIGGHIDVDLRLF